MNEITLGLGDFVFAFAATVTLTEVALTVVAPIADKAKVYLAALVVVLAGSVTGTVAVPLVQGTVSGSPVTVGDTENAQLVAPVTEADSVAEPPVWGSEVGVAENDTTLGGTRAATLTVVVALAVLVAVAERVNL